MVSDLNEWLKERRTIHNAATEGEWWRHECKPCADRGSEDLSIWSEDDPVAQWLDSGNPNQRADRDAIVDAHNTLLTLLTAVEDVLELHQPKYLIRDGEWIPASCAVCEPWTWPCATVRAIEGANQ